MRKQKIIAIFIICLLLLVFNINICNAQENIEVGVKKRTGVSFSSTEQNITYFTNSNFKIQKIKVNENEQDFLVGFDIGKTKVEDVISDLNIVAGYKVQAFKNNKKLQNNEKIGTGTVIKVYDTQGKEVKNYIALVYGDVNGDGNISSMDGLAIIKHRTNKVKIQDSILLHAARVTENTRKKEIEPTSTDALAIVKAKLGKYTITNEQYYKGFEMKGTIKIPRTGIEYPILANAGKNEIEVAVGIMYPRDAQLNTKGNITITGHNYRDDTFFSNNKNIELGDKIYITDETGKTLEYVVYNKYETTPQDSDYITRDTQDNTEITLTTVTDDAFQRLIIYAKAN